MLQLILTKSFQACFRPLNNRKDKHKGERLTPYPYNK